MKTSLLLAASVVAASWVVPVRAEIVERHLGKDENGNAVTGYVLQGGRDSRRSSRSSGLSSQRIYRAPQSYRTYPTFRGAGFTYPYWYVPIIPLHCGGGTYGGSFTLWHGHGDQVSVTLIR